MIASYPISLLYLSILAWFYFILSALVIRQRIKLKVSLGFNQDRPLEKIIRTHGNFAEYIPLGLILVAGCEHLGAKDIFLHLLGSCLILGRILHYFGMMHFKSPNIFRVTGMTLTFVVLLTAPAFILYRLNLSGV